MGMTEREVHACNTSARSLSRHPRRNVRDWFALLAQAGDADGPPDSYGEGAALQALERRVAELLGTEAGVFVIKGVIAQQAALRVWTDRSGVPVVALHPACHLDRDEAGGYERLHRLAAVRLGTVAPFTAEDLEQAAERLGVVTVELPLRRAGFRLPNWDELVAISRWCRENGVPLHLDGARLWESTPYYGRTLAEIVALVDSVYVSFYKGLGGLAGCVLAGSAEFVAAARPWIARQGGSLATAFPYVLAATEGLERYLPRMPEYHARAVSLAAALAAVPGVFVAPTPPHTNAFQVYLPGAAARLRAANLAVAEADSVWLFDGFAAAPIPGLAMAEVQVGEATADLTDREAVTLVSRLVDMAA